jgi:hypothetical protein
MPLEMVEEDQPTQPNLNFNDSLNLIKELQSVLRQRQSLPYLQPSPSTSLAS